MARLLGLMFVSLACVVPAMAQDAPQGQSAAPNAAQHAPQVQSAAPNAAQDAPQVQSAAPKAAQDAPQGQSAAPKAAQNQDDPVSEAAQAIERNIQAQLAQAGFTDIELLPTSFLVRAKDADGNAVMLMLSPDTISQLQGLAPDAGKQDDSSDGDATSRRPTPLPPGYDVE